MNVSSFERVASPALAFRVLLALIGVGLVGDLTFALQASSLGEFTSVLSVAVMVSVAALLVGGLLGFLFGVPRTDEPPASDKDDSATGERRLAYRPNTSLEQISDWLTKILVGVGLTQIGAVPGLLKALGEAMKGGLGGFGGSTAFGAALGVHFAVCGFLLGWLWARLYLRTAFMRADDSAHDLIAKATALLTQVEPQLPDQDARQRVKEIRGELDRKLAASTTGDAPGNQRLTQLGAEYEQIRKSMPSGWQRVVKMSEVIAKVRALVPHMDLTARKVGELFTTGKPGNRVVALAALQTLRYEDLFPDVLESVRASRSAFEQSLALRVIQDFLPRLTDAQKAETRTVLEQQRGPRGYITRRESDRWLVSSQILQAIAGAPAVRGDAPAAHDDAPAARDDAPAVRGDAPVVHAPSPGVNVAEPPSPGVNVPEPPLPGRDD